jgi:translation elongation factor aEF-1 beta
MRISRTLKCFLQYLHGFQEEMLRMATAGIQFKIMPEDIDTDLEKLKIDIKTTIETFESGVFNEAKEEPIAFGLKALIVTIALSEDEESDAVEKALSEIEGISSVELIDYRRVVG